MKITRKNLQRLIETFLKEDGTGDVKGSSDPSRFNSDPNSDDFELTDDMLDDDQSGYEEYSAAVDAYRNPKKPIGNMPHFSFGNEQGVTSTTKGGHIPTDSELEHVRRYQAQELGGAMPSVDNREITVTSFEEDEDTEESPFGTQRSLRMSMEPDSDYDFDDSVDLEDVEDYGTFNRDDSQDVITYEDEDGNERTFLGGKEITPGSSKKDQSFIERIRNYFSKK